MCGQYRDSDRQRIVEGYRPTARSSSMIPASFLPERDSYCPNRSRRNRFIEDGAPNYPSEYMLGARDYIT